VRHDLRLRPTLSRRLLGVEVEAEDVVDMPVGVDGSVDQTVEFSSYRPRRCSAWLVTPGSTIRRPSDVSNSVVFENPW
jgi:hypothetical protein